MPDKPTLTIMADTRGRWLWSHDMSNIILPDDTIFQANLWLEKYAHFCENPDYNHLLSQFNPEGMNLATQVQLSLSSGVDVFYTDRHPNRKAKKGATRQVSVEYWSSLYSDEPSSKVDVHTPLSLMDFVLERCEDSGAITEVEPAHYQQLINMGDAGMRDLIHAVIFFNIPAINDTDHWKSDDALLDMLESNLYLILCGVMYFPESGGELVICKPTIMPTEEEKQLLRTRAATERETIREVLWGILHEQVEKEAIT